MTNLGRMKCVPGRSHHIIMNGPRRAGHGSGLAFTTFGLAKLPRAGLIRTPSPRYRIWKLDHTEVVWVIPCPTPVSSSNNSKVVQDARMGIDGLNGSRARRHAFYFTPDTVYAIPLLPPNSCVDFFPNLIAHCPRGRAKAFHPFTQG